MRKAQGQESNTDQGKIFLLRNIRSHWIWKDPRHFQWWVDIIMEVNYQPQQVAIGFKLFDCGRGQSVNSLLTWSKRWGVDKSTVVRFFNLLESARMITRENLIETTRLTICNYDSYNSLRNDKQPISNRLTTDTQPIRNTNNTGNTVNTGNTGEVYTGDQSPPSPPLLFSTEDQEGYKKFTDWITKNAGQVAKMKEPFTIDQFLKVRQKYPVDFITKLLGDMHNWVPLIKKNASAYHTFLNWAKRDENRGSGNTTIVPKGTPPPPGAPYTEGIKNALAAQTTLQ